MNWNVIKNIIHIFIITCSNEIYYLQLLKTISINYCCGHRKKKNYLICKYYFIIIYWISIKTDKYHTTSKTNFVIIKLIILGNQYIDVTSLIEKCVYSI